MLIVADDFGRELMASYGGETFDLPTLDGDGWVRFETCYATPLCSPSRVELISARYPFRSYHAWGELARDQPTFVRHLRDAGYRTVAAGKWHMGGWGDDEPGIVAAGFESHCSYDYAGVLAASFEDGGNQYWGGEIITDGVRSPLTEYGPDRFARFVTDAIAARPSDGRPLFAYYGINLCHRPFMPTSAHPDAPPAGQPPPRKWMGHKGDAEHFPAMVRHVDAIVGRILDAIDAAGVADDTVVVFTSDNGTDNVHEAKTVRTDYLGRSVEGGKYFPTELGLNVPLLWRWPGTFPPRRTAALTDFTDIGATLCAIAGAEPVPQSDGRDLRSVLRGESDAGKAHLWSFGNFERSSRRYKQPAEWVPKGRLFDVVRGDRWKWVSRGQLYDLDADWFEESPVRPPTSREHRERLKAFNAALRGSEPKRW